MNPVEIYHNISHTQMSIARRYGGLKVNGSTYEYDMDRKFIGIEIDNKYFDIACKRIEDAQRQERLF